MSEGDLPEGNGLVEVLGCSSGVTDLLEETDGSSGGSCPELEVSRSRHQVPQLLLLLLSPNAIPFRSLNVLFEF